MTISNSYEMSPKNLWGVFFKRDPWSINRAFPNPIGFDVLMASPGEDGLNEIMKNNSDSVLLAVTAETVFGLEKEIQEMLGIAKPGMKHFLVTTRSSEGLNTRWMQGPSEKKVLRELKKENQDVMLCGGLDDLLKLAGDFREILTKKNYMAVACDRRPGLPDSYGMTWLMQQQAPEIFESLTANGGWRE